MKINKIMFYGFSKIDLEQIKKETGKLGEEEYSLSFSQEAAEAVKDGVTTIIFPDGAIALFKGK